MEIFLGIDWGGTYIKAGLVTSAGKVIKRNVYSSVELKKKPIFIKKLQSLLQEWGKFKIKAIGIGAPGIIDVRKGFIYYLPNISGWKNYPLRDILRKRLKIPVYIDNDANVFALAEARLGAAKNAQCAIFLTLGTGLGSAIVWRGEVFKAHTSAAELGHVPLSLKGPLCGCGSRGCIETFVGNGYLLAKYKELEKKTGASEVKEIFKRALKGERCALRVWKDFSFSLGRFLAGMVNVFNPDVIVFGGGMSGAFKLFKPLVFKTIKEHAMWPHLKDLKLVKAKLKDAGIIGAAILGRENLER